MGDRQDKGCPPPPSGLGDRGALGSAPSRSIVPFGGSSNSARPALSAPSGVFFCALGGVVASSSIPIVAPALLGYGLISVLLGRRLLWKVAAPVCAAGVAVGLSASSGLDSVVTSLVVCLSAALVALAVSRERLTPGVACAIAAVMASVHLGADAVLAGMSGTSLPDVMRGVVDAFLQGLDGASVQASAQAQVVGSLLGMLWPTAYALMGFAETALCCLGMWLALSREGGSRLAMPKLTAFDLPLWIVTAFVASVAVLAVELTVPALSDEVVIMVSANVVLGLRFAFATQGLGVLTWLLGTRKVPALARTFLLMAALYLELQFFVLTVVGLVDVWTNFRHLQRGREANDASSAKQDREPGLPG